MEVLTIQKLKNNKATGVDNVSCKFAKIIAGYISKLLAYIINKSIETSILPDHFKKAEIIPSSNQEIQIIRRIIVPSHRFLFLKKCLKKF